MKALIIDDEQGICETLEMILIEKGYEVATAGSGEEGMASILTECPDFVILDIKLPGMDGFEVLENIKKKNKDICVIMMTAYHDMRTIIKVMKLGAHEYIHKPIDVDEFELTIEKVVKNLKLSSRLNELIMEISVDYRPHNTVGKSRAMQEIYKTIGLISESKTTVLIQGETGTGKELIAKAIHYNSPYKNEPFVPVNCSAMAENLFESELFGHEKGSFTGAIGQKKGKIELARGGTLLLDEIGEISLSHQVKLLRFLQEREFERVGGGTRIKSDVRIIAATNRDLSSMVTNKLFREDFYFRIKVVEIRVPPLRERKSDIPVLVEHLLNKINLQVHKRITQIPKEVMDTLVRYQWPGNVRELENLLTRAVVLSKGSVLLPELLSDIFITDQSAIPEQIVPLKQVEEEHIKKALIHTNWNKGETCRLLGISRPTLRQKIVKYSLLEKNLMI